VSIFADEAPCKGCVRALGDRGRPCLRASAAGLKLIYIGTASGANALRTGALTPLAVPLLVSPGGGRQPRARTQGGQWRRKRSDTGKRKGTRQKGILGWLGF
jgi:hypothetical protein